MDAGSIFVIIFAVIFVIGGIIIVNYATKINEKQNSENSKKKDHNE